MAALGAHTSRIRVGSGGVVLPNHSPYVIAEQFAVLEALVTRTVVDEIMLAGTAHAASTRIGTLAALAG